jgi:hypothetical protein
MKRILLGFLGALTLLVLIVGIVTACYELDSKLKICHWDEGQGGKWTTKPQEKVKNIIEENGHKDHPNDIIPSFDYKNEQGTIIWFPGLNWNTAGKEIYGNSCEKIEPTATSIPPTFTATSTVTATITETPIPPTDTPEPTATTTETPLPTATATNTEVPTDVPTATFVPTDTSTAVPTATETEQPTVTETAEPTESPTPAETNEPTATPKPKKVKTVEPEVCVTCGSHQAEGPKEGIPGFIMYYNVGIDKPGFNDPNGFKAVMVTKKPTVGFTLMDDGWYVLDTTKAIAESMQLQDRENWISYATCSCEMGSWFLSNGELVKRPCLNTSDVVSYLMRNGSTYQEAQAWVTDWYAVGKAQIP